MGSLCVLVDIKLRFWSQQAEPVTLGKDIAVVSGLLEVVVILWRSVEKALKQNEEAQKYIFAKFGNVMAKYFQAFEVTAVCCNICACLQSAILPLIGITVKPSWFVFQDERCTVPLVQLASFMPPAVVPTFRWTEKHRCLLPYYDFSPLITLSCLTCLRHLLPCFQLWRSVQIEEVGPRSCANTVQPVIRLHLQLGPGSWHPRTHHWLAHWSCAQTRGQWIQHHKALNCCGQVKNVLCAWFICWTLIFMKRKRLIQTDT